MCPNQGHPSSHARNCNCVVWKQKGAGLPLAIFLITVMALIAVTLAQLQQTTGEMESQDIQSVRAFYAAESGAQLALTKVVPEDPDVRISTDPATCPDSGTTVYENDNFAQGGLSGCGASVTCECDSVDPDDSKFCLVATIKSEGSCGSGLDEAQREIEVRAQ